MRGQKRLLILLLMLCAVFVPLSTTAAQTAEPTAQVDDASAYVINAIRHALTHSYHFTLEIQDVKSMTGADKKTTTDVTLTSATGEVASNGDSHLVIDHSVGTSIEEARTSNHLVVEYVVINRIVRVKVTDELKKALNNGTLALGWFVLGPLPDRSNIDSSSDLLYLVGTTLPSEFLTDTASYGVITEGDKEVLGGVPSRVFTLKVDIFRSLMSQMPGTPIGKLLSLVGNSKFYLSSTFDIHERVWIGSQNGHLLRVRVDGRILLPYLSSSRVTGLPYNLDQQMTIDLELTHYGEPVEIDAPTTVE